MLSRIRPLLYSLALLLAVSMTTGCTTMGNVFGTLFLMSPEQEIELGQKLEIEVAKEVTLVQDPMVVDYVRAVGRQVSLHSEDSLIKPHFFVVKDKEINAFAIPGGNIYVHTGMIEAADDEAELAAVLAHENGHVIRRHSARHVSAATGFNVIEQILLGDDAGQVADLVSGLAGQVMMLKYSRDDEREADNIGIQTLHKTGYDPMAMRTFFMKLREKYGSGGGKAATLFASHPPTDERMNNVSGWIKQLPEKTYRRPVTDLRRIQGRLQEIQ